MIQLLILVSLNLKMSRSSSSAIDSFIPVCKGNDFPYWRLTLHLSVLKLFNSIMNLQR